MVAGITAVVVAAVRVYEGRHWPSDVLCTAALGLAYALPALLHPDPRWRAGVTFAMLLACGALDLAARQGLHLVLPAGTASLESLVRAVPFGTAYGEGLLRGAWSLDAPDPRRSSAWLRARTGAMELGPLDARVTALRVVSRPEPGGEGAPLLLAADRAERPAPRPSCTRHTCGMTQPEALVDAEWYASVRIVHRQSQAEPDRRSGGRCARRTHASGSARSSGGAPRRRR